jgi:DNA mismatch endonuclease, patch repair protein
MADVFSREKRSAIMSSVRSHGNLATELRLITIFKSAGIQGWRRRVVLYGSPDFAFPKARLAVFVDGCFWHCCPVHGTVPTTNRAFWMRKLRRNQERDRLVRRQLEKLGWRVLRIWQHELRDPKRVLLRIRRALATQPQRQTVTPEKQRLSSTAYRGGT